jgi:hypothetical protein
MAWTWTGRYVVNQYTSLCLFAHLLQYPGADDRGGKTEDTANYVSLLKEMREAWGTSYGELCSVVRAAVTDAEIRYFGHITRKLLVSAPL